MLVGHLVCLVVRDLVLATTTGAHEAPANYRVPAAPRPVILPVTVAPSAPPAQPLDERLPVQWWDQAPTGGA